LPERSDDVPDADGRDGQPQPDAEAHVKIEIIGKDGIHGAHARVPAVQDAVLVEDRIGNDGDDQAHQAAHHRPERQHHADEHQAQVQLDTGGDGRQTSSVWRVSSIQGIGISRIGWVNRRSETVGSST
jgi:hypothetical protein